METATSGASQPLGVGDAEMGFSTPVPKVVVFGHGLDELGSFYEVNYFGVRKCEVEIARAESEGYNGCLREEGSDVKHEFCGHGMESVGLHVVKVDWGV